MKKKPVLYIRAVMFVGLVVVIGLTGPAFAKDPNVVLKLDEILDRLDQVEAKIDNQSSDLQGVTQNWDKKLDATNGDVNGCNSDRFTCLFEDTVVRDNETGLVWERSPSSDTSTWLRAMVDSVLKNGGGRFGWQVPTVQQLYSLKDSTQTPVALPAGHPFLNVVYGTTGNPTYWSSTELPDQFSDTIHLTSFGEINDITAGKNGKFRVWLVRSGENN